MSSAHKKSLISLVSFLFALYGQSFAQRQRMNFPSAVKVNTLAISDSTIYAGTDGDGIFVSTDNGENWNSINAGLQSKVVHTIFINGTTVFAGTETGASRSTNSGFTWNTINTGLSDKGVWSFAARNMGPGDSTIFAGTWSGVYTSSNYGTRWDATGLPPTTMPVHSLIIHKSTIFAATLGGGVFHSTSNGFSWNDISLKYDNYKTGEEAIIPVYSLAVIDTHVVASAGSGSFYYMTYADTPSTVCGAYGQKPILCFASRNANSFAGNSIGNIVLFNFDKARWDLVSSLSEEHGVYSLALSDLYIFAGTESSIWRLWYPQINTYVNNSTKAPIGFSLEQNYPNPFNSSTRIKFTIPSNSRFSLKVYDILGKVVDDLVDKTMMPGTYEVEFTPAGLPSGIFFYSLVANDFRITKKLMLLK